MPCVDVILMAFRDRLQCRGIVALGTPGPVLMPCGSDSTNASRQRECMPPAGLNLLA